MKDAEDVPTLAVVPSTSTTTIPLSSRTWNTEKLGLRLGSDVISAACAGALIAPLISLIDRSIMENASGAATLANSLKTSFKNLLLRPTTILFSKPAALIFMLYGGTYLTANTLDTVSSTYTNRSATHVTTGTAKFAASSAANVGLCIYKDQVFVRMFGPPGVAPRPVTVPTYTLFALRDMLTIFASFNVPPILAPYMDNNVLSVEMQKHISGATTAQFLAPAAVQLASTPLHLLGLDIYNRHTGFGWGERWEQVRRTWLPSAAARICRIVPAFGVGGVVNTKVRRSLMGKLER